ncbi:hypothetical protein [Mesorhizobium shangrilense]|uniref:Uncharacterized protein n=1 Tax=Mesorhizobium shangrilense TaxID=460060 RepID=A0ABV2DN93_9HYPH
MVLPEGVLINGIAGGVTPETGRYTKRLSELAGIFQDKQAFLEQVRLNADPLVYEVSEYRKDGADLFFGTTHHAPR